MLMQYRMYTDPINAKRCLNLTKSDITMLQYQFIGSFNIYRNRNWSFTSLTKFVLNGSAATIDVGNNRNSPWWCFIRKVESNSLLHCCCVRIETKWRENIRDLTPFFCFTTQKALLRQNFLTRNCVQNVKVVRLGHYISSLQTYKRQCSY